MIIFYKYKKYFKKIHGQHENVLLEIQLIKITSPKRPILKDRPYFIFWRSTAWCRVASNFLSLLCYWTLITEQRDLQECCNYISKDGLSDKGTINEQWKFNQLWPIHYQAWGKIQTEHLLEGGLLFLCSCHLLLVEKKERKEQTKNSGLRYFLVFILPTPLSSKEFPLISNK